MITHFYVDPKKVGKDFLKIEGDEAKHISLVLRKAEGDVIEVVDGQGLKYQVRITATGKDWIQGEILSKLRKENEPLTHLTLAQAMIKGVRMDFLMEKITEIGVSSIIPLMTEKSLVKFTKDGEFRRLNRWKRIAISGMKQSLRSVLPEIHKPVLFDELLAKIKDYDLTLIACKIKKSIRLRQIKENFESKERVRKILLIVGPESGFSPHEIEKTLKAGAIPISLGPRRLRSETAGIVFSSLVLHELEDLG
jgi:16S rRNA (uracil1498-N3)-methyltransferase